MRADIRQIVQTLVVDGESNRRVAAEANNLKLSL
jgi:hypothetical protein